MNSENVQSVLKQTVSKSYFKSSILDKDDEYVPGYTTTNLSISKTCWKWVRFQIGCDNLTNYKDPMHIPTLAGRLWWGSIQLTINDHLFKKN